MSESTRRGIEPQAALPYFEQAYREKAHPAFAWLALRIALTAKLPIPDWVLAYFLAAADRMSPLFYSPPKDPATAVLRALGFRSRRGKNPLHGATDDIHDSIVARELWFWLASGDKWDRAIVEVIAAHPEDCVNDPKCERISEATIARCWRRYKSRYPPLPKKTRPRNR